MTHAVQVEDGNSSQLCQLLPVAAPGEQHQLAASLTGPGVGARGQGEASHQATSKSQQWQHPQHPQQGIPGRGGGEEQHRCSETAGKAAARATCSAFNITCCNSAWLVDEDEAAELIVG
jgi:hypothetical protein